MVRSSRGFTTVTAPLRKCRFVGLDIKLSGETRITLGIIADGIVQESRSIPMSVDSTHLEVNGHLPWNTRGLQGANCIAYHNVHDDLNALLSEIKTSKEEAVFPGWGDDEVAAWLDGLWLAHEYSVIDLQRVHAYASHTFVTKNFDDVVCQMGLDESIPNDKSERKEDVVHAVARMFEVLTEHIF